MREMTKETFAISKDGQGREYVYQKGGEADKNHGPNNSVNDTIGEGLMYAQPKWGDMCPVATYRKYLAKLHTNSPALWQRALDWFLPEQELWYSFSPVGIHTLGQFMPRISRQAGLSKVYTNHCIRATAIVTLDECGLEARHIMRLSGHRYE